MIYKSNCVYIRKFFYAISFFILSSFLSVNLYAQEESTKIEDEKETVEFTIRFGQGGFNDSRSPINKLGGDQLALDIRPKAIPIALSISSEFYTNSPDPTHNYEISSLVCVNILYTGQVFDIKRLTYFIGGGSGWIEVPRGENYPSKTENTIMYDLEAGINMIIFSRLGIYATAKHLIAHKTVNNVKVIDFDENIVLLGFSYRFSF